MRKTAGRMTVEVVRELSVSYDYSRRTEVRGRAGNKSGPDLARAVSTTQDCGFWSCIRSEDKGSKSAGGDDWTTGNGATNRGYLDTRKLVEVAPKSSREYFRHDYGIGGYTVHGPHVHPLSPERRRGLIAGLL